MLSLLATSAQAQRDGQRRSPYQFDDDATSLNNEMLENLIARFPEADKNEDGILDAVEGRAVVKEQGERWREQRDRRRRGVPEPTHADVAYGPHTKHTLDLYLAKSDDPTPLVVFFHGGQFITGDKDDTGTLDLRDLLRAGISVASVNYRFTPETTFPTPFEDAAQAVQFLRLTAAQYNLDPERFAGHGEEAGGNLALYLALHDDLATKPKRPTQHADDAQVETTAEGAAEPDDAKQDVPKDDDAAKWESPELATKSTRLIAAVARHPIASFDPRTWAKHELPMNGHERMMTKYLGTPYFQPMKNEVLIDIVEAVSPLALVSEGDPELLLMSQYPNLELAEDTIWTVMSHHPKQSQLIAEAMRAKGNKATVRYRGMKDDPGTSSVGFFIEKLK